MAAEPKTISPDDPGIPSLFRILAGGTFTGGKSFWLAAPTNRPDEKHDKPHHCSPSPDPEPKREPG